ncbi:MAG: isocitrate/isopropylmalate dehydrogenase family protein [Gemmatimonadetes bacterium]|nr:isocitrate/isopropylmalate dehydrogenase family protein [Gemmatimonadota bacterium]
MSRIAVIPGDGIGVEVTQEAVKVLRCIAGLAGLELRLDDWDLGAERYLRSGVAVSEDEMLVLARDYDAILLGALGDPRVPDHAHARAILLGLRTRLDLYVNFRPVQLFDAALSPLKGVAAEELDVVIFRENTEGLYSGAGGQLRRGTPDEIAIEEDVNTRRGVERIIRAAFQYARAAGRGRVTLADKANAMRYAGELWRRVFAEVGAEFPGIERHAMYIDALALDLVLHPAKYDVIVTCNLFGDILSDLAAALAGGLGLAPSANLHPGRAGLFEPVHGSAPDLAGTGRANPMAAILSAALLLDELGLSREAHHIQEAVRRSIRLHLTTPDLGGTLTTPEVGDFICEALTQAWQQNDTPPR